MTIRASDAKKLFQSGFTHAEIRELANAVDPLGKPQPPIDLSMPMWQATMAYRRSWSIRIYAEYNKTHKEKLTRTMYTQIVDKWYRGNRYRNPWDWLKAIYRPKNKIDFTKAAQKKAQDKITNLGKQFKKK